LVPAEIVDPLISNVMNAPADKLLNVSAVFDYKLEPKIDSFDGFVCEECGEMTVMEYGRIKGEKKVCMDCAVK
jgi:formylmethanofuran dehydrogenase subunit E